MKASARKADALTICEGKQTFLQTNERACILAPTTPGLLKSLLLRTYVKVIDHDFKFFEKILFYNTHP